MNFWLRYCLLIVGVIILTLAPKYWMAQQRAHARPASDISDRLRAFLVSESRMAEVTPAPAKFGQGWLVVSTCRSAAFVSGQRGTFDMNAKRFAAATDEVVYVYRGRITPKPPTSIFAKDIIVFKIFSAIAPVRMEEPHYILLIGPADCPTLLRLRWTTFKDY